VGWGLRGKFDVFAEHRHEYDAVYMGSSNIYRSFRPDVIDPLLSRPGQPFRSFNLGMSGMANLETDALLDRVLALESSRLSWIVLEAPSHPRLLPWRQNFQSMRAVSWHPPRQTSFALISLLERRQQPILTRLQTAAVHLALLARWQSNLGAGPHIWSTFFTSESEKLRNAKRTVLQRGGYKPLSENMAPAVRRRRENFLAGVDGYQARVEARSKRPVPAASESMELHDLFILESQRHRITEAGLRIVYVECSSYSENELAPELARRGYLPALINFGRPDLYPDLYDTANRFDSGHLNQQGAEIFGRLFAREFAPLLEATNRANLDEAR
jgi:hypothetical protein